ncbi:sel1 repeat family protein [Ectopseudomonas mendocina]|uniref:Sel1 repeat family protein n=1 Tax=Ectopseudomonas mendocina TaxID=300 RepID=A0ABZ2RLZ0_ECTME
MFHTIKARLGYWLSRRLFHWRWLIKQPRMWAWMEGQFSRMANLGDREAQSFYGHILLFRGQGAAARNEGRRLLTLAAKAGDAKSAYQLGVISLAGDLHTAPDATTAVQWWTQAAEAGHPAAAYRLSELYRAGAQGVAADPARAEYFSTLTAGQVGRS